MTPSEVASCFEAVCGLPVASQAVCVQLAAEPNVPLWTRSCAERDETDYSRELLTAFESWLAGTLSNDRLWDVAARFQKTLPKDLPAEKRPAGGYAGWALFDIALIALDRCEDVHEDILHTAICYSAAAHAGVGPEAVSVRLGRLTARELEFMAAWWARCCKRLPELRRRHPAA